MAEKMGAEAQEWRFEIADWQDPYASLPALAERLGVAEGKSRDFSGVYIRTKDGRDYNVFALAHAFLDRMERANG